MERIKKKFGFGMMRLPMNGEDVNIEETKKMVDALSLRCLIYGFFHVNTAVRLEFNALAFKKRTLFRPPRSSPA